MQIKKISFGKITTSNIEIQHLFIAWLAITAAFAIAMSGAKNLFNPVFGINFIIAAITVGFGFVAHEMAHKILAQKYNCFAEFRANNFMLIFAILISFTGMIFAAPGAVMISGVISRKAYGKIAASGPAMNILLALLFLAGFLFSRDSILINSICLYGMTINSWLAMFNVLPFPMFDGLKIMEWDKVVYGIMIAAAAVLLFLTGWLPGGL
jgi:Zn-dependent protease